MAGNKIGTGGLINAENYRLAWEAEAGEGLCPEIPLKPVFPRGKFAKALVEEYWERLKEDYGIVGSISFDAGKDEIRSSNHLSVVMINKIARFYGYRAARLSELEPLVFESSRRLHNRSEDVGLILHDGHGPNSYLANALLPFVRARIGNNRQTFFIPLDSLDLRRDSKSPIGVSFVLGENPEIIPAPEYNRVNENRKFTRLVNGVPDFDDEGPRYFYSADSGLSGVSLTACFNLNGRIQALDSFYEEGQIVLWPLRK